MSPAIKKCLARIHDCLNGCRMRMKADDKDLASMGLESLKDLKTLLNHSSLRPVIVQTESGKYAVAMPGDEVDESGPIPWRWRLLTRSADLIVVLGWMEEIETKKPNMWSDALVLAQL
jgi:hypothetical protein